jgi:hypothetical protein
MSLGRSKSEQAATNVRIYNRRYWRTHRHTMPSRKEYFAKHYQANRERKLAAAKARKEINGEQNIDRMDRL